jgi:16S rRNA (adenine1518-N6/adenine1519-N6)-dimethyltransferase
MQTKRQIQQLLEAAGIRPNKRLGQHFLVDLNLMRLLVDSADIKKNDFVLEVGCGTGSLTEILAEKAGRVVAVELDAKLIQIAQNQLQKAKNIDFINVDILENKNTINPTVINSLMHIRNEFSGRFLLVANLPYNVGSPVMLNLTMGPIPVDRTYVTVQKEVADRMTAEPNSKNYGILSIILAATGNVKTIRKLKPQVFWPRPKVDSAMVCYEFDPKKACRIKNMQSFREIVGFFMGHRRKTILACSRLTGEKYLKIKNWTEIFLKCDIDSHKRPDELSPDDYINITKNVKKA